MQSLCYGPAQVPPIFARSKQCLNVKLCQDKALTLEQTLHAPCEEGPAESDWGTGTTPRLGKARAQQRTGSPSEHTEERGWGRQDNPGIQVTHLEGALRKQFSILKLLRITGSNLQHWSTANLAFWICTPGACGDWWKQFCFLLLIFLEVRFSTFPKLYLNSYLQQRHQELTLQLQHIQVPGSHC